MITAKSNDKIKAVTALVSSAKRRREAGVFVLEGTRLCSEALDSNILVNELYFTEKVEKEDSLLVSKLSEKAEFSTLVSTEVFGKISDTKSPQGILAVVSLKTKNSSITSGKWLGFERVSDPSNLGAAARTAEALGFSGILLSGGSVDPYSPKSLRASMGALLRIPVVVCDDFLGTLSLLRDDGFSVVGTVLERGAENIQNVNFGENSVALIGNEANGLTDECKDLCDKKVYIPMDGRAESLNAAAAATILMWEMVR